MHLPIVPVGDWHSRALRNPQHAHIRLNQVQAPDELIHLANGFGIFSDNNNRAGRG